MIGYLNLSIYNLFIVVIICPEAIEHELMQFREVQFPSIFSIYES